MDRKEYAEVFRRLSRISPEPKTELRHGNPYQLLVAVVLSAQATDKGVNAATQLLFREVDTPEEMIRLGEAGLMRHIRTIGLFRNKAKNVIGLSETLLDKHSGEIPHSRESLESLPGVGRKTANVVLNVAFGEPTIAVDTHIFRVGNRTGLAPGRTPREVEDLLVERVPARYKMNAHHWLILHGRYICTARTPKCGKCPIADLCNFKREGKAS